MNCANCGQPLNPGDEFCPQCGTPVPQPAGGRRKRIVVVGGDGSKINIGTAPPQPSGPSGDYCPICGAYNPPEGTFRCARCKRPFICLKHQDPATYWCVECAGRAESDEKKLFHLNYQFVYPFLPMGNEALAQVLISFTSREDADLSDVLPIPTHLCLVLDVSGSMNTPEKYPLLRQAIPHLIEALSDDDHLTIILFSQGCDILLSEPVAGCRGRAQEDAILQRMDRSGVMFGRMTLLAPGLRAALDEIEHFRSQRPMAVNRLYILTDGQLHDAEECYQLNPRLRALEAELHSYGFGHDFALETMKRIMEGIPGGTVKAILNTHDVKGTFGHIGDLAQRIVAQDAEFAFSFAKNVIAGDAFRYRPGTHYFGPVSSPTKEFKLKLGALERDRIYTFMLEGQLRPSSQPQQEVGKAELRYRYAGQWEKIESSVIISRTEDEWRCQRPDEHALDIYDVLHAIRDNNPEAQLKDLRARRAIYRREGADPALVALVERSIAKLERRETLSEDESRGLAADLWTDFAR